MGNYHASFGERDGATRTVRSVKVRTVPTPLSPVLAPGYRPSALALWVDNVVQAHGRGEARWCRDADAGGCAFRAQADAERFSRGLPQRLKPGNLQVAPENTHGQRLRRWHPSMKRPCPLLGFAFAWRPDRPGVSRVRRRTARTKLHAACHRRPAGRKACRHVPERDVVQRRQARLRGHDT